MGRIRRSSQAGCRRSTWIPHRPSKIPAASPITGKSASAGAPVLTPSRRKEGRGFQIWEDKSHTILFGIPATRSALRTPLVHTVTTGQFFPFRTSRLGLRKIGRHSLEKQLHLQEEPSLIDSNRSSSASLLEVDARICGVGLHQIRQGQPSAVCSRRTPP